MKHFGRSWDSLKGAIWDCRTGRSTSQRVFLTSWKNPERHYLMRWEWDTNSTFNLWPWKSQMHKFTCRVFLWKYIAVSSMVLLVVCLSYPDTRNEFGEKNVFFLWSAGHRLLQVTVGSLCLSARDVQIHSSLTPGSWGLSTGRQEPKQTWKVSLWICGLGSTPCTLVHSGEHDMIMCLPYCKSHFSSLHY